MNRAATSTRSRALHQHGHRQQPRGILRIRRPDPGIPHQITHAPSTSLNPSVSDQHEHSPCTPHQMPLSRSVKSSRVELSSTALRIIDAYQSWRAERKATALPGSGPSPDRRCRGPVPSDVPPRALIDSEQETRNPPGSRRAPGSSCRHRWPFVSDPSDAAREIGHRSARDAPPLSGPLWRASASVLLRTSDLLQGAKSELDRPLDGFVRGERAVDRVLVAVVDVTEGGRHGG